MRLPRSSKGKCIVCKIISYFKMQAPPSDAPRSGIINSCLCCKRHLHLPYLMVAGPCCCTVTLASPALPHSSRALLLYYPTSITCPTSWQQGPPTDGACANIASRAQGSKLSLAILHKQRGRFGCTTSIAPKLDPP